MSIKCTPRTLILRLQQWGREEWLQNSVHSSLFGLPFSQGLWQAKLMLPNLCMFSDVKPLGSSIFNNRYCLKITQNCPLNPIAWQSSITPASHLSEEIDRGPTPAVIWGPWEKWACPEDDMLLFICLVFGSVLSPLAWPEGHSALKPFMGWRNRSSPSTEEGKLCSGQLVIEFHNVILFWGKVSV